MGLHDQQKYLDEIIEVVQLYIHDDLAIDTALVSPISRAMLVPVVVVPSVFIVEAVGHNIFGAMIIGAVIGAGAAPLMFAQSPRQIQTILELTLGQKMEPSTLKSVRKIQRSLTNKREHVMDAEELGFVKLKETAGEAGLSVAFVLQRESISLRWETIPDRGEQWDTSLAAAVQVYKLENS